MNHPKEWNEEEDNFDLTLSQRTEELYRIPNREPNQKFRSIPNEVKYLFDSWVGNEDVLTLCKKYIQELEHAIQDGVSQGLITGK